MLGIYANDVERLAFKAYKTYKLHPTATNFERCSQWAEKLTEQLGDSLLVQIFIPIGSFDGNGFDIFVQRHHQIEQIIKEENPFRDQLDQAEAEYNNSPNQQTKERFDLAKQFYGHVRVDWQLAADTVTKDTAAICRKELIGERPADLPRFPYPRKEAAKYSFRWNKNRTRLTYQKDGGDKKVVHFAPLPF